MARMCLVVAMAALLFPAWASADCAGLGQAVEAATAAGDVARSRAAAEAAAQNGCEKVFVKALKYKVAIAYSKAAQKRIDAGENSPALAAFLNEGLAFWPLWALAAKLGDLAHQRKDYTASAKSYLDTLELINDPSVTPTAPPARIIAYVKTRAEEARTLSAAYVPAPVSRGDGPPAALSVTLRGFKPEAVTVPVRYVFAEAKMTADGEKAAAELFDALTKQNLPRIRLVGHTDPRGSAAVNDKLSQDRANSLKEYLVSKGYTGQIETRGAGSREPIRIDDPKAYTEEELYQLQRRVEFVQVP